MSLSVESSDAQQQPQTPMLTLTLNTVTHTNKHLYPMLLYTFIFSHLIFMI